MRRYILFLGAFALIVVSCVYPFEPDLRSDGEGFVIDGDLNVGSVSKIKLSYVQPFGFDEEKDVKTAPSAIVKVEGEDGISYSGNLAMIDNGIATYDVDLTAAPFSSRYRLVVHNNDNRKDYVSSWLTPVKTPTIERFWKESTDTHVKFFVTFHGNDDHSKYRIYVDEVWRHHAHFIAQLTYYPETNQLVSENPDTYYCYCRNEQKSIDLLSTEGLNENKIYGHTALNVSRKAIKFQDIYKVTVNVQAFDDGSYRYWTVMRDNTETTGSLYQTVPSQVVGNIRCQQDTTEMVYGYINASAVASKSIIVRGFDNLWDSSGYKYTQPFAVNEQQDWFLKYLAGYRPYMREFSSYLWTTAECVDCRQQGGTNVKPAWWEDFD